MRASYLMGVGKTLWLKFHKLMTGATENNTKGIYHRPFGKPPSCGRLLMGLKSRRHFLPNCAHCRMTATALPLELFQLDPHVKIEHFNNVTVSFPDPFNNSVSLFMRHPFLKSIIKQAQKWDIVLINRFHLDSCRIGITDLFTGREFSLSQMDNYFASSNKKGSILQRSSWNNETTLPSSL